MIIEIPEEHVNEVLCNLENIREFIMDYSDLKNCFVDCEIITLTDIINKLSKEKL